MTALYIIGIILGIIAFFAFGYYLWSIALEKYDHNIFSLGVIIRGIASFICLLLAMDWKGDDGSGMVWLIVACVLWLWTFLATWTKSNLFIALFSLAYQVFAVFLIMEAINRFKKALN
ncbi:MAG TPA: hypothetical protein VIO43_06850 [Lutibacter sp.]